MYFFFFSVRIDYMTNFHAVFHGLKAASQSVLLLFINILLLGLKRKAQKHESTST